MSESKHTPTPYRVGTILDLGYIRIESEDGPHIAIVRFSDNPALNRERGLANAEFYCRACNAHDALLATCKKLMRRLEVNELLGHTDGLGVKIDQAAYDAGNAAIAKVENE